MKVSDFTNFLYGLLFHFLKQIECFQKDLRFKKMHPAKQLKP